MIDIYQKLISWQKLLKMYSYAARITYIIPSTHDWSMTQHEKIIGFYTDADPNMLRLVAAALAKTFWNKFGLEVEPLRLVVHGIRWWYHQYPVHAEIAFCIRQQDLAAAIGIRSGIRRVK